MGGKKCSAKVATTFHPFHKGHPASRHDAGKRNNKEIRLDLVSSF